MVRTTRQQIKYGADWIKIYATGGTVTITGTDEMAARVVSENLADVLALPTLEAAYLRLVSQWNDPLGIVPGTDEPATPLSSPPDALQAMANHQDARAHGHAARGRLRGQPHLAGGGLGKRAAGWHRA